MNCASHKTNQSGNVLFLILIAVALFAGLSYAVTGSTRSGSGSVSKEIGILDISTIQQYGAQIKTSVIRQILSGVDVRELKFNPPSDFGNCPTIAQCVYHPDGGAAVYSKAPDSILASGTTGQYFFNMDHYVQGIGISGIATPGNNDLIMFLFGLTQSACEAINEQEGIAPPIPSPSASIANIMVNNGIGTTIMDHTYTAPNSSALDMGEFDAFELFGKAQGCIDLTAGNYAYYQVIVER